MESVFSLDLDQEIIAEYSRRSARKKEDEKWLKENRSKILAAMARVGRDKADVGNYRVVVTKTSASKFDPEKVTKYLLEKGRTDLLKYVYDEVLLNAALEEGSIDAEELVAAAWVEKEGSPRLKVVELDDQDRG